MTCDARLTGDLDAIVRKAMHADPAQRYASANLLREDLRRYLEQRPVSAHPGGVVYRTRKFIARHRAAVAAGVLIALSLAGGATVAIVESNRARARQAAAVAEAAMRTKYEAAMALHHKGDIAQAAAFFREAVDHGRRMPHVVNAMRVDSVLQLARLLHLFERDPAAAEPLYREAVNLARALHRGDHEELGTALQEHAKVLLDLDRPREAEPPGREALAMWRRLDGATSEEGLGSLQMLGDIVARQNRDDEAEALYREALSIGLAVLKQPHSHFIGLQRRARCVPGKAAAVSRGGAAARGRAAQRLGALWRDASAGRARVHRDGDHHAAAGAFEEAERFYRRAVTVRQQIHPAPHWRIAEARSRVGYALFRQRRYEDAEALLTDSYTRLSSDRGAIPESADRARAWLVELYDAWNRPGDAARYRVPERAVDSAPRGLASAHGPR